MTAELVLLKLTFHIMRYLLIFFGLLLVAASCAPTPTDSTGGTTDTTSQYKNNISTLFGAGGKNITDNTGYQVASNIIWKDSLGTLRSLDSLKGKIILLNFWATWCSPCDAEMADLDSISASMAPDVVVIGVSVDKTDSYFEIVRQFAVSRGMKFQVVIDPAAKTYSNYGGNGTIPWTFAIDRTGHIVHKFEGQQTKAQFMDILNQIP